MTGSDDRDEVARTAAAASEVLAGLLGDADDEDELMVTAYQRGFVTGAAAALRVLADLDRAPAPDRDGRGRGG